MHIENSARAVAATADGGADAAAGLAGLPEQARILSELIRADLFEQVIQSRYLGTKRFSLEGLTVLIPFLRAVLGSSSGLGVNTASWR